MTKQKKRREIRLSDVPEDIYQAVAENAKKELTTQGKIIIKHLIKTKYVKNGNK